MSDPILQFDKKTDELYLQSKLLSEVVKRVLGRDSNIVLDKEPSIRSVKIVEFMKRMRVTSWEKFDKTAYISTINLYLTEKDIEKNRAIGAVIVYILDEHILNLFKKLKYPIEEEEESYEDACGTLCNVIVGNFKAALTQWGYKDLVMPHFLSYKNDVPNGVAYDFSQKDKYEISFVIADEKMLVIDLTLGKIPKDRNKKENREDEQND
ncbi:MAG: hypothetical protein P9X22_06440 [Candidatus Zapsychrus exili]|nr:hypothetical protein [Candidatus Zapsychrus exili]